MTDEMTAEYPQMVATDPAPDAGPEPTPVSDGLLSEPTQEPMPEPQPGHTTAAEAVGPIPAADLPVDAADTLQAHAEKLMADGKHEAGNALLVIAMKLLEVHRCLEDLAHELEGEAETIIAHLRSIL